MNYSVFSISLAKRSRRTCTLFRMLPILGSITGAPPATMILYCCAFDTSCKTARTCLRRHDTYLLVDLTDERFEGAEEVLNTTFVLLCDNSI